MIALVSALIVLVAVIAGTLGWAIGADGPRDRAPHSGASWSVTAGRDVVVQINVTPDTVEQQRPAVGFIEPRRLER